VRVVVVGATGNVGSTLVEMLGAEPRVDEIVGVARRKPETLPPKTTFATADIARDDLAPLFVGADAVVHLAWLFQPTHNPLTTWRANVEGSIRLFDAVAATGARTLVYASSVGAYSPGSGRTVDESWATDGLPTAAYSREKAYVERALDVLETRHPEVRVVRLRPAFIFKRSSATEQRRLFAGPFLPGVLLRPGRLPVIPYPAGLRFQALHSRDAAHAYRLALLSDARGAFNIASEPIVDAAGLAEALDTRAIAVPPPVVRAALALAWKMRLAPADPQLFDVVIRLPLMDTQRAKAALEWAPRHSSLEALQELFVGMAEGAGGSTPPLEPDSPERRLGEIASGIGTRA
jgi:UDP-glucose 4-epimerase